MEKVIILKVVDDLSAVPASTTSSCSSYICRICHEGGGDSFIHNSNPLEAPCSCNGSLKFAHRECIQRWCNEKGNTICEICLQNFEPGYTAPTKKVVLIDSITTLRARLAIQREEEEEEEAVSPTYSSDCLAAADRGVSCCKYAAFILTVLLLVRHLVLVLAEGTTEDFPFTLPTLLILRASGIIFPMFILVRILTALHNTFKHYEDDQFSIV